MPDAHTYGDAIHDAERAAAAGDFAGAETSLRHALDLQERLLGAAHPDLASTLNNLAVVCETNGRLDEAEQFYRRAHAVATAALPPGDALVETSRANLEDFCRAHQRPVDDWPELEGRSPRAEPRAEPPAEPPAESPAAPTADPPVAASVAAPPQVAAPAVPRAPAPRAPAPRGFAAALVGLAAAGTLTLAWFVFAPRASTPAGNPAPTTAARGAADAPAPAAPQTPARSARDGETAPAVAAPTITESVSAPAPARPDRAAAPAAPPAAPVEPPRAARPSPAADTVETAQPSIDAAARLVDADLCTRLTRQGRQWTCAPAGAAVSAGTLTFYTRVASARAARIEHRWYRDDVLARTITLSVGASDTDGYRTFSQQTVTPGRWRVEVRTADGRVLREASVDVRD